MHPLHVVECHDRPKFRRALDVESSKILRTDLMMVPNLVACWLIGMLSCSASLEKVVHVIEDRKPLEAENRR